MWAGIGAALGSTLCLSVACDPPRPRERFSGSPPSGYETDGASPNRSPDGNVAGRSGDAPDSDCRQPELRTSFSKRALLASIAECAQLRYCEFGEAARVLSERADAYADDSSDDAHTALSAAFQASIERWARAELFQFGPAASSAKDMDNGQGLRDLIYAWPNVSRCRVEEQLFGRAYSERGFDDLIQVPINSRGLFAVEYLAFYAGDDNDCSPFSITNADDAWQKTRQDALLELKLDYLKAVAHDVSALASKLIAQWDPGQGDFESDFVTASGYMDQQQALGIAARSLLYAEVELKDYKIGVPAGLYDGALLPELPFAGGAGRLIAQNLAGFRDLFQGCDGEGLGFDDWLEEAGHGDLASDILDGLTASEREVADFPELDRAAKEDLQRLHQTLKRLTDPLKGELFGQGSPLGLTLPSAVEGDTD